MKIYFAAHSTTTDNENEIASGWKDVELSDLGVQQSKEMGERFKDLKIGQQAIFTVDAFGSKQYSGIVDEISPTSDAGDIVFNISGTRQEMNFDVKVRFNTTQYPELKNGMSAKVWIQTN